jgi:hypothetical protein
MKLGETIYQSTPTVQQIQNQALKLIFPISESWELDPRTMYIFSMGLDMTLDGDDEDEADSILEKIQNIRNSIKSLVSVSENK